MNLSNNFTLAEMLESQAARRHNIAAQFDPPDKVIANLKALCENILQPLRDAINIPIHISSGYRSSRVNEIVGGAATSQHLFGQAADIQGANNAEIFRKIINLGLPFDQLIWEYGTKDNPAWVHVSFGPANRRQILYIPKSLRP